MQQPEEAHAVAEAERGGGLGLVENRGIREAQLVQRVAEVLVVRAVGRIEPGEDHRLGFAVAGQRFGPLPRGGGHRVADAHIADLLEPGRHVADIAGGEAGQRLQVGREAAHLHRLEAAVGGVEPQLRTARDLAVHHPHMRDHALVGVVFGVEDQRAQRLVGLAFGWRNALHDRFEQTLDALARLGRDVEHLIEREADHVGQLGGDRLRPRDGQVDLVDHGHQGEVLFERQIDVGERLRLNALRGVDDEQRALRRRQAARDLVGEIDVPGRVDQMKLVGLPVARGVLHPHRARLDRDALLALQRHAVQQLVGHVARVNGRRGLQQPIGEGRLAVVDMRDDAEVANGRGHVEAG